MIYKPKSRQWDALELLSKVMPTTINISQQAKEDFEPILWNDVCSEYDAEHFCNMLEHSGLKFSDEFISFERVWRRDEYNHYLGCQRIYHLFYGLDEKSIIFRLKNRHIDFSGMREFLLDEFNLCLLLAYDELATTWAYREDVSFYKSIGPSVFHDWIKLVIADEANHYLNSIRVAQLRHRDRLSEAENILMRILEMDLNTHEYNGTFVLDHTGSPFTPKMLRECVTTILDVIHRPYSPFD